MTNANNFPQIISLLSGLLDGGYHKKEDQRVYDSVRTGYLKGEGIEELRFQNDEVMSGLPRVLRMANIIGSYASGVLVTCCYRRLLAGSAVIV